MAGSSEVTVVSGSKELTEPKAAEVKKVLTEEQKQAIRDRFTAGKPKAALARGETPAVSAKPVTTPAIEIVKPKSTIQRPPVGGHPINMPGSKPVSVKK